MLNLRHVINKDLNGVFISDELHTSVGSGSFTLLHNTFFGGNDLIIRTAPFGGGTLLIENTHFILENQDSRLSTEAGKPVYISLRIIDVSYQSGDLYVTYKTVGDFNDAADFNYLNENKIDSLGWVVPQNNWVYDSADRILEAGDLRNVYQPGDKIMLTQSQAFTNSPNIGTNVVINMPDTSGFVVGNKVTISSRSGFEETTITAIATNVSITVAQLVLNHNLINPLVTCIKYAYIASVSYSTPNTIILLATGSDYRIADAPITSPRFSKIENPAGFPDWFNWIPNHVGFSAVPTNMFAQFRMSRNTVFLNYAPNGNGISNANSYTVSLPPNLPAKKITNGSWTSTLGYTLNNGTAVTTPGRWVILSGGTLVTLYLNAAVGTWGTSGAKQAQFQAIYPTA